MGFGVRELHNFTVFRLDKLTFTHFSKSGHVNCSGTARRELLSRSLDVAEKLFGRRLELDQVKISSSTWSGRFAHTHINIPRSAESIQSDPNGFYVSLRPSVFPGAVVRHPNLPTLILFANGKFVAVGVKKGDEASSAIRSIAPHLRCFCCRPPATTAAAANVTGEKEN